MEDGLGVHYCRGGKKGCPAVLILVLVEDGLGASRFQLFENSKPVLILVLVEDGLGAFVKVPSTSTKTVLILVLVEDGLGASTKQSLLRRNSSQCLNPCFSGGWSRSCKKVFIDTYPEESLNPCFSGGWSRSSSSCTRRPLCTVLILVLVEDGLGAFSFL